GAQVQLEAAIRVGLDLFAQKHAGDATSPGCHAALDHGHAEVARVAALAGHPIGVAAIYRSADVERVSVVAPLFAQRVEVVQQLGMLRVVVLELEQQRERDVARQEAHAGRAIYAALRRRRTERDVARRLELVTEPVPGLLERGVRFTHRRLPPIPLTA